MKFNMGDFFTCTGSFSAMKSSLQLFRPREFKNQSNLEILDLVP